VSDEPLSAGPSSSGSDELWPRDPLLARSISDVIVTLTLDLRPLSVTPSVERLLGFTPQQFVGRPLRELMAPDSAAIAEAALAEELARESDPSADPLRSRTIDLELRRSNGTFVWSEAQVSFIRSGAGRPSAVAAVVRDISAWRAAQERVRESEERLRQIIDLVPHFVFAKDLEGRFLLVNRAVAEAYGTTVEELTGRTDADFARSEEEVRHFRGDDLEVIESGQPKLIPEERITDARGNVRWLQTVKIPFTTAGSGLPAVLGVATDISEQRHAEERLRASEEQLRHDQKMRAIGQLAGGVAHDFNNLLTVILGNVQTMLDALAPGAQWRAQVEQIGHAAERAAALTRQLLAFSRKQLLTPVELELDGVVREAEQMLRRLIGEPITLSTALAAPYERVRIDRGQLDQILFNLTVNARDAMPEGGSLRFETAVETLASGAAAELGVEPGSYLRLAVVDSGEGMDRETRNRAFEPFFTTKPGSTGLGLSTVYGIVHGCGGAIAMTTSPGRGTRVDVYLPRIDWAAASPADPTPSRPSRGGETVLVVEDEAAIRQLLQVTLDTYGYRVLQAPDGESALQLLADSSEPVDLLLTDVVLPGMSGPKLAETLADERGRLAVLFMSGYPQDMLGGKPELPAHVAFIAKPFKPRDLATRVREVLDARGRAGRDPA